MQLSKIAFAVAAVCAATAATAAPNSARIAKSGGASAVQNNVRLAVESLCVSPNVVSSYVSGNFTTVVCADVALGARPSALYASKPDSEFRNFAGLPFAEIRFNVSYGSFGNILILNPTNPANAAFPFVFLNPSLPLAASTEAMPTTGVVIGGINDVEPSRFPVPTIGANVLYPTFPLGAAQVFGVAASLPLYTKMFDAQKAAGLIPTDCLVNSTTIPYCIPNIAKAQMATIMSANDTNAAYSNGLGFLTGVAADNGTELRYVRRVNTSGTQASAQNYFLGLPCSANSLSIVDEPTTIDPIGGAIPNALIGNIRVYGAGGTSNVLTELNKTDANTTLAGIQPVYALGVASGENNQTGQTWRWLRVDGAPIGENTIPASLGITNSNTQKDGSYSFYFEATYTGGPLADTFVGENRADSYWATIASAFGTLTAPVGLVNQTDLNARYTKGGLTCLGSSSN